ncbi:MAG: protein-export chaperone SecB [Oscillospiraceae bacterium]|nr:protein-export chaperone SecB [Oscillospiraceae bacterium]
MNTLGDLQLVVEEISIKNNDLPAGQFQVDPILTKKVERLDDTHHAVRLLLELKNTEKKPFPIELRVSLTGIAETSNVPEEAMDNFLNIQAVQIMFPYIRTMVTSLTSAALMQPLILPFVDVRQLFQEQTTE